MTFIELDKQQQLRPKGKFVIFQEDDRTVYSTNSYFWWSYFRYDTYIKQYELKPEKKLKNHRKASISDYIKAIAEEYKSQLKIHPDKADILKKEFKAELERLYG